MHPEHFQHAKQPPTCRARYMAITQPAGPAPTTTACPRSATGAPLRSIVEMQNPSPAAAEKIPLWRDASPCINLTWRSDGILRHACPITRWAAAAM